MDRESRETWAKRVERWTDSGLTAKEFAAEVGVNPHSLKWWKWRLSSAPARPSTERAAVRRMAPGARRRGSKAPSVATSPLTFVEIPAATAAEPLELVLPSSVRVRVPSGFDAAALGRLLDVLDARR
jgi:hypothetical protein